MPETVTAVPLLDVAAQNRPLQEELVAACTEVIASGRYIMGPKLEAFEAEFLKQFGGKHALAVSSGTDALLLALMTLGIGPGDEVLCPAFTFFATAGCISRLGATPVFVDVCPVCFGMDPEDAAHKATSRTKAIIPVHLFGQMATMAPLLELARDRNLAVIEDVAQALGASWKSSPAGTLGDFGAYSFFPSKNLGGFGDGGLLVIRDPELAEKARILRVHGAEPKYFHRYIGANFRMDALQAALLSVKLPWVPRWIEARRENAAFYRARLGELPGVSSERIASCPAGSLCHGNSQGQTPNRAAWRRPSLILPMELPENRHTWNQFTVRVPGKNRRDALKAYLQERQIGCEIYYPLSLDMQECFAGVSRGGETIQVAHRLAEEVLSLPIYPELEPAQLEAVVMAVEAFLQENP